MDKHWFAVHLINGEIVLWAALTALIAIREVESACGIRASYAIIDE